MGAVCSLRHLAAAGDGKQEACLQEAADFLGKIQLPTENEAQWASLLNKSREFYPTAKQLALDPTPAPEFIDALQSLDAELPECDELIDQVDELAPNVPCFEREFPKPEVGVRELVQHSTQMETLMEKYLVCQYGTDKW